MNKKRTVVLSVGFLSLAIFAVIVSVMVYMTRDSAEAGGKSVAVYVAAHTISAGQKIRPQDIELRTLPAEYAGETPLSMADIVDRYAVVDIIQNDPMRLEKLASALPVKAQEENRTAETKEMGEAPVQETEHDLISIPLSVFKNPDTSLRSGDRIDIVGLWEQGEEKPAFATRYIALRVKIAGFMKDGKKDSGMVFVSADEKTQAVTKVLADEVLLDMSAEEIGRFLSLYYRSQRLNDERFHNPNNLYRGHIWMVRSNEILSAAEDAFKKRMMGNSGTARPAAQNAHVAHAPAKPVRAQKGIVSYEQ